MNRISPDRAARQIAGQARLQTRRRFSALAGAFALAAPFLAFSGRANASDQDNEGNTGDGNIHRVRYRASGQDVILNSLVLQFADGSAAKANIGRGLERYNEYRLDAAKVLGDLSRPRVSTRLKGAATIGAAMLSGRALVLVAQPHVSPEDIPNGAELLIVHRQSSWELRGVWDKTTPIPPISAVSAGQQIGKLCLSENTLMAVLPPETFS